MTTPRERYMIALDRDVARRGSLYEWAKLAWPYVERAPYVDGWHIQLICEHLEAVTRCEIRNLVINIPPGCMKSLLVTFWQLWGWIRDPSLCYIVGSFDQTLVTRDAGKMIALAQSAWFRDRWGDIFSRTNPSTTNLETAAGGFRFATSPGGRGTGRHGNMVILDDPLKPKDAITGLSGVTRKTLAAVHEWRVGTLSTRQKDPATHRNVLVMQRLSFEDTTAEVLQEPDVVHLCLPMHFDPARRCVTRWGTDPRTQKGELLFPARYDATAVDRLALQLGPRNAAAQLEQRPNVSGGSIFRRDMWRFWSPVPREEPCLCEECFGEVSRHATGRACVALPGAGFDVQSWDLSFKGNVDSDPTAGSWWRFYQRSYFLRGIFCQRVSFSVAKLAIQRALVVWPASSVLVEDAANGPAIASEIPCVELVTPQGGKVARAHVAEACYAIGAVYLPHPADVPLVWQWMAQHEAFPASVNDDMVDCGSQALAYFRGKANAQNYLDALTGPARI